MHDRVRMLMGDTAERMSDTVLLEFVNDAINEVYTRTYPPSTDFCGGSNSWSGISGGAYKATSQTNYTQNIRTVLSVNRHTSSSAGTQESVDGGYPLEEVSFSEIMQLITNETTQGAPTKYHLMRRLDVTKTDGLVSAGLYPITWILYVHPICDGTYYFSMRYIPQPSFLTSLSGGTGVNLFGKAAPDLAARIAAARAARVLGQPSEFVDNLWASVEEGYAKLDADLKNRWKVAVPA